jgi:hypothetical protein
MRTHATNRVGKTSLKNCQILENVLEISRFPSPILRFLSPKIRFSSPKIKFPHTKSDFPQSAFYFLQRLSDFLQWLSNFPRNPRKSIYGDKDTKDHYLSFVFFATHSSSFIISATIPNTLLWCTCVPNRAPYLKSKLKYNPSRI